MVKRTYGTTEEIEYANARISYFRDKVKYTLLRFTNGEIGKEDYDYDTNIYKAVLQMWEESLVELLNRVD